MKKYSMFVYLLIILVALVIYEFSYPSTEAVSDVMAAASEGERTYIKWIDFTPSSEALSAAAEIDMRTYESDRHIRMYEVLAVYAAINGGDFSRFKTSALESIAKKYEDGTSLSDMASNQKLLTYYLEAYEAILSSFVGEYTVAHMDGSVGNSSYGIRVFSPIAKGFYYGHSDDFGASRSYGYKRKHLGHDLMGSVGTPVVAIEGGYVEACGWNVYGGWRIGIRSFDGKRYYYYAHLRKGHPYNDMYEGKIVNAGEVIGYLGMTGYSTKEDTNNISTPHLHFGLQIIFDPSQKDGANQIWLDMYAITNFLYKYRSRTERSGNESISECSYLYPETPD